MEKTPLKARYEYPFNKLLSTFWDDTLPVFDNHVKSSHISLAEDDKAIYIEANLPGLQASDIDVTLENKVLWVRGHRKEIQDDKKYHYRSKKSYSYQIALPESIDETKEPLTKYEHGVLSITFQKSKGGNARRINIQ
jgi:HSP20 family protein